MNGKTKISLRLIQGLRVLIPLALSLLFVTQCNRDPLAPGSVDEHDVPNYGVVIPGRLYRSAQVTEEGFEYLYAHGLKTVINLRYNHSDREWVPKELRKYYHEIRIPDHCYPTEEQLQEIISIVRDPESWPVLIHCKFGRGRTGVVIAIIRYSVQGWKMSLAVQETRSFRKGQMLIKEDIDFLHRWAETHKPGEWKMPEGREEQRRQP